MSTPSVLFLAPATLDSDLPVVVFASATPQIDSDAPPELDSRVSRVSAEPFANPARARTVEEEAPMDGRETAAPVFYVPFQVFHSLESNSAPDLSDQVANAAPGPSDQVAISTRAINARVHPCIDLTVDSDEEVEIHIVTTDSLDRANGATTEEDDGFVEYPEINRGATTEDDGDDFRDEQRRVYLEKQVSCAQPREDEDEVEPPLEQIVVIFGVHVIRDDLHSKCTRR